MSIWKISNSYKFRNAKDNHWTLTQNWFVCLQLLTMAVNCRRNGISTIFFWVRIVKGVPIKIGIGRVIDSIVKVAAGCPVVVGKGMWTWTYFCSCEIVFIHCTVLYLAVRIQSVTLWMAVNRSRCITVVVHRAERLTAIHNVMLCTYSSLDVEEWVDCRTKNSHIYPRG